MILFGNDAKFVIGFNSHKSQALFNDIEILEYSEPQKKFTLSTIKFVSDQPVYSEINSQLCLSCHGQDPKPIWDSYGKWRGTYGSDLDRLNPTELGNYQEFV